MRSQRVPKKVVCIRDWIRYYRYGDSFKATTNEVYLLDTIREGIDYGISNNTNPPSYYYIKHDELIAHFTDIDTFRNNRIDNILMG